MVRSDRLSGMTFCGPTANTDLFTVPAGETWLVKRVCLYNASSLVAQKVLVILTNPTGDIGTLYAPTLGIQGADDHDTWWALDPGCTLFVQNQGASGNVLATTFGAKLLGAV